MPRHRKQTLSYNTKIALELHVLVQSSETEEGMLRGVGRQPHKRGTGAKPPKKAPSL